ncbi:hypothetical protein [Micromonospora sp. S-DT3-3-22]|uniref:hypothetical protein n=1 Tax=Micromonospora sp. S-DT3-3-22 TaxID=2755359 RepID=UPI0018901256|nr:hypothetical protein [Micromonospora sp. S-DT3-3-22]
MSVPSALHRLLLRVAGQIRLTDAAARLLAGVPAAGAPDDLLADRPRSENDLTPPCTWTPGPRSAPGPTHRGTLPAAQRHDQGAAPGANRVDPTTGVRAGAAHAGGPVAG